VSQGASGKKGNRRGVGRPASSTFDTMGLIGEVMKRNDVQIALQMFTVVNAIVGIAMAITTHVAFSAAVADYSGVVKNWETVPVTQLYATDAATCLSGDEELQVAKFKGTNSTACACSSSSGVASVSSGACDDSQLSAGCVSQAELNSMKMLWHGKRICLTRSGHAQIHAKSDHVRPLPSCPRGYQQCGTGTYDNGRSFCYPENSVCPYTGLIGSDTTPTDSGFSNSQVIQLDSSYDIFYTRSGVSELPFAEFEFSFYDGDKRGICYRPERPKQVDQSTYKAKGNSYDYVLKYRSECKKEGNVFIDSRYEIIEELEESDWLLENFEETEECRTCTQCSDFLETGTPCGSDPFTSTDCLMYGKTVTKTDPTTGRPVTYNTWNEAGGCSTSDVVCKNIMYQSKCGALKRWASQASNKAALFARREIYWKSDCGSSMLTMTNVEVRVAETRNSLLAVLVLSIIINLITGLVMPYLIIQNLRGEDIKCIPGEGEAELKIIKDYNKYGGLVLKAAKSIPSIIAVAMIAMLTRIFDAAAKGNCSDVLTNKTMLALSEMLPEARGSLITVMVIDAVMFVQAVYETYRDWRNSQKEQNSVSPDDREVEMSTEAPASVSIEAEAPASVTLEPEAPSVMTIAAADVQEVQS